jgi:alpha-L-fucosidase
MYFMFVNRKSWRLSLIVAIIGFGIVVLGNGWLRADDKPAAETKEQRDKRMAWWRDARFGMFIHWGVYSVPAGTWNGQPVPSNGEWIMCNAKIPVLDYAKLPAQFNPVKFDADQFVATAKNAGMKYMVITAKHHDGFAMFHSKVSPYNIYDATPFKRDPLQELAAACHKQNMPLGFYYSQAQDWHQPGGAAIGGHWDKAQDGDMDKYIDEIAVPQVKELLTNYGPLAILWWDTPQDMTPERAAKFLPLLKIQPGIITNNRLGGGDIGDTETPEQFIPPTGYPGRDWETCMTLNDTWGYKSDDNGWKPTETLVRNLIDIASKGGNYLLNVGPTSEGVIPQPSVDRLAEVGQWMKVNGEAIYGTSASAFKKLPWGRCTQKPGKLYLHVFNWPKGKLFVPGLKNRVTKAYLLADASKKPLAVATAEDGVNVEVSGKAPNAIASVVVLEIEGAPNVADYAIHPAADGKYSLNAADVDLHGEQLRYQESKGIGNIGWWTNPKEWLSWDIFVKTPGKYAVSIDYACASDAVDSDYIVALGNQKVAGHIDSTGDWDTFKTQKLGTLTLTAGGPQTIAVKVEKMPKRAVMNLKSITLMPVQ